MFGRLFGLLGGKREVTLLRSEALDDEAEVLAQKSFHPLVGEVGDDNASFDLGHEC